MAEPVSVKVEHGIAIVTIANPPVNALGHALRLGLSDAIARIEGDPAIESAVVIASGRTFPAGANIGKFDGGIAAPDHATV